MKNNVGLFLLLCVCAPIGFTLKTYHSAMGHTAWLAQWEADCTMPKWD